MNGVPKVRAVWSGLVIAAFSLVIAYVGLEGLITGHTRALSKLGHYEPLTGGRAIIAAAAYLIFAVALASFAAMSFSREPSRQEVLFKWGKRIGYVAAFVLVVGLAVMWAM